MDDVVRTDQFIDALAAGRPVESNDPADQVLAALIEGWRNELRSPPANDLVTEAAATAALRNEPVWQRRTHRGLTVIWSAA
ncbi:MAG: anti-sigma-D factor RsdA, partial [Mycobacterium sp.]